MTITCKKNWAYVFQGRTDNFRPKVRHFVAESPNNSQFKTLKIPSERKFERSKFLASSSPTLTVRRRCVKHKFFIVDDWDLGWVRPDNGF